MQNHSTVQEAPHTGTIDVAQDIAEKIRVDRADEPQDRADSRRLPTSANKLFWIGGNIGLGDDADKCYFTIEENGVRSEWTIAETLARIDDFSELARTRILACCTHQVPGVRYDALNDQRSPAASSTRRTSP